jgi:hypothetical protein
VRVHGKGIISLTTLVRFWIVYHTYLVRPSPSRAFTLPLLKLLVGHTFAVVTHWNILFISCRRDLQPTFDLYFASSVSAYPPPLNRLHQPNKVRKTSRHCRYTVRAWCSVYETTHIRCRPNVVAVEFRFVTLMRIFEMSSRGSRLTIL